VNLKELKELISLMNDNKLVEMEIEREGTTIRLKKEGAGVAGQGPVEQVHFAPAPVGPVPTVAALAQAAAPAELAGGEEIKSPMVGTFYSAPSPDSDPFVQEGDVVKEGQVLCIIEAMKLMNEFKSEVSGKIRKIVVENAQPIEFGQPLFIIDPA